ncbi:hypothetical protein IID19_02725 [Patescibacteria group bacterium]|nr:hypothetical protein [Patescibacteria group bacterium]
MSSYYKRSISTFWGISILLMESVVVVFVFYILYFFWIENPTPTSNILIVRTVRGNVLTIPKQVDTTGWIPYTSNDENFSLMYPADYQMSKDIIVYGEYAGNVLELTKDGTQIFSLRIFPLIGEEVGQDDVLADVFERLTSIDPGIFQAYEEDVADTKATVYRQVPGETPQDYIYFLSSSSFFETVFDNVSADILATFNFIE